jgi:hypothetical protein
MRFLHDFGDGIRAELILTDDPPTKGGSPLIRCDWCGGRPSLQHLEQYLRWTKEVYQTAADHWGIKFAHVVQTGPRRWECWGFEPNTKPVLAGVIEPGKQPNAAKGGN